MSPDPRPRTVAFYVFSGHQSPVQDWMLALKDRRALDRIQTRIKRISLGNLGDHKRVGQVTEFRIDHGPGYRLYAGLDGETLIVLLAGGDKSTQAQDIREAESRWQDYLRRK